MEIQPNRFAVLFSAPVLMTMSERTVLYAMVFGLRPQRAIEIGTHKGGSALIITAALDDLDAGSLVCIDPHPLVAPEHWARVAHRAVLISGQSPDAVADARVAAGGTFDFALVDGDHESDGVIKDVEALLPHLSSEAYLLFHDAHYWQVAEALNCSLARHQDSLTDCGMVSVERTPENRTEDGRAVVWGGLRMLRYRAAGRERPAENAVG